MPTPSSQRPRQACWASLPTTYPPEIQQHSSCVQTMLLGTLSTPVPSPQHRTHARWATQPNHNLSTHSANGTTALTAHHTTHLRLLHCVIRRRVGHRYRPRICQEHHTALLVGRGAGHGTPPAAAARGAQV
eukprot:1159039-Pelagomonas_calceolata.AAC.4